MNNENNVLPDNPSIEVIKAGQSGIFTNYIYKAIPLAFDESMSYYETLLGLLNYLKNVVIPTVNNNADAVSELQNLYIELHDYVEHYFDNLDVQDEINQKLDKMAEDGSLTNLIKNYVDPIQEAFENEVNNNINLMNSKINAMYNNNPIPVSSTSGMTDQTKIYVNTTDGKWYYYNTSLSTWSIGGTYQSTQLGDEIVKLKNLNSDVIGNLFKYDGIGVYAKMPIDFTSQPATSIKVKAEIKVIKYESNVFTNPLLFCDAFAGFNLSTGTAAAYNRQFSTLKVNDLKDKWTEIKFNFTTSWQGANAIQFSFQANDSNLNCEYEVRNVEIFINDSKIETFGINSTFEELNAEEIALIVTPLATQKYVDSNINMINQEIINLTPYINNLINEKINQYDSIPKSKLTEITCFGDSLTEGGSPGKSYPQFLNELIPYADVINCGVSGQCSGVVAFRQGANVITNTETFTIPTTGSIEFNYTVSSGDIKNTANSHDVPCSINGINGIITMSPATGKATFTRSEDGNTSYVELNTRVYPKQDIYNNDTQIIWIGRNDMAFSWPYMVTGTLDNIQSMVNNLIPDIKRFLILTVTPATNEKIGNQTYTWITQLNEEIKSSFPYNYVDIFEYVTTQCIYDMGITPTSEDLQNMEDGTVPPSIMYDQVHFKEETREYIARYIYNVMISKDWILD